MNIDDLDRWHKEADSYILLSPNSIGEAAVVSAFCNAFSKQYKAKPRLVVRHEHKEIADLYSDSIREIISASMSEMRALSKIGVSDWNEFVPGRPVNLWATLRTDGRLNEIHELRARSPGRGGLGYSDLYRHLMHLDWDAKLQLTSLPESIVAPLREKILKLDFNPLERNVIIFPSNNSNIPATSECWRAICDRYHEEGCNIYLNYHGGYLSDFRPPKYAKVIQLGIFPALVFSELCKDVVISSNGLVMLMLLLRIGVTLNVLLPENVAIDGKTIRGVSSLYGSHRLIIPEAVTTRPFLREFRVGRKSLEYSRLADSIVNGSPIECEVSEQIIHDVFYESWIDSKKLSFS